MKLTVAGLFAGQVRPMPDDGRPTAIFKLPVAGRVRIGALGMEGDAQADRRVHGGPEQALHHFPQENHERLAARFPQIAGNFIAGALGENISTRGVAEGSVCIGDVYALGSARVQLSQPRSPCWKIDARHACEGIASFIAGKGIAGWYYRVLEPGEVEVGDVFELLERNANAISLRRLWDLMRETRPDPAELDRAASSHGLTQAWQNRLRQRADWLRRNV